MTGVIERKYYECPICEAQWEDLESAEKCFNRGRQKPKYKIGDRFSIGPEDARSPFRVKTEIKITGVIEGHSPEYYLSDYILDGNWQVGVVCQYGEWRLAVEKDFENLEWLEQK